MTPNDPHDAPGNALPKLPRKTAKQKERALRIAEGFAEHYPDATCELDYASPCELLIATILSAQATDVGVNKATPALFKAFPTPAHYAKATPEMIEPHIKSIGLYRNKAKSIHAAMTAVVEQFDGAIPRTMKDLLTLRGVARKTANVVLGNAYRINVGFVVDTHIARIAQRYRLTKHTDPKKIELDLMALFPRESWTDLSHQIIWHGRRVCKARGATCSEHPLCVEFCSNAQA
jgi:endonuclease-3